MTATLVRLETCPAPRARARLDELHALLSLDPVGGATPARTLFVASAAAKAWLAAGLAAVDAAAAQASLACALTAYDFSLAVELLSGEAPSHFAIRAAARSAALQGVTFLAAARAVGLEPRPIAHFDACALRRAFFPGSASTVVFATILNPPKESFP